MFSVIHLLNQSINTNCTKITLTMVQVFLQRKKKLLFLRKPLKNRISRGKKWTLQVIGFLSNYQERLTTRKVSICCECSGHGWIRGLVKVPNNVKILPFQAHWSPALYLPAFFASVTSRYTLRPEHEVSFLPSPKAGFLGLKCLPQPHTISPSHKIR